MCNYVPHTKRFAQIDIRFTTMPPQSVRSSEQFVLYLYVARVSVSVEVKNNIARPYRRRTTQLVAHFKYSITNMYYYNTLQLCCSLVKIPYVLAQYCLLAYLGTFVRAHGSEAGQSALVSCARVNIGFFSPRWIRTWNSSPTGSSRALTWSIA